MQAGHASWRAILGTALACSLAACGGEGAHEEVDEAEITRGRLAVGNEDGTITLIDLDEGAVAGSLPVPGVRGLYANPTGRYAYALRPEADAVTIFESGIELVSHGDHAHVEKGAPSVLDRTFFHGPSPASIALAEDWVTVFYEGDGSARFLRERAISAGSQEPRVVETGSAHEGFAITARGAILTTVAEGEPASVATAIAAHWARDPGTRVGDLVPCAGARAGALLGEALVFPCDDGLLVATVAPGAEDITFVKKEYSAGVFARVSEALVANGSYALGSFAEEGATERLRNEAEQGELVSIALDGDVLAHAFDRHGAQIVALLANGSLVRIDSASLEVLSRTAVIPAFDVSSSTVRPALAIGAEEAYVSDPRSGRIFEVALSTGDLGREFEVAGSPSSLIVFGISPDYDAHAGK